jgi:hypothetical protein
MDINEATKLAEDVFRSEHGNSKADYIICAPFVRDGMKKAKCIECGTACYHTKKMPDVVKKNLKKICIRCALKNLALGPLERSLLEYAIRPRGIAG